MNAEPILAKIAKTFDDCHFDEPPHALSEGAPAQRRVGIVVFILTT